MIRVLHVIDSLDLGGAQTALLNLITPADRGKFHHEVAAMHGRGMYADAFESMGIPVHSLSSKRFPPEYLIRLPQLLKRGSFDIVHCHLFGSNFIAKPLAALLGCRCIYNHDQCNDAFRFESPWVTAVDAITNDCSKRIFCVSKSISEFLIQSAGVDPEKLVLLPNSVDTSEFRPPSNVERAAARKLFRLPEDAFVVGGIGRFTAQKQFSVFIDAASRLHRLFPDWVFVLFGSGPLESALRKQAEELGDSFRFAGTTNNRVAMTQSLDMQLLTSAFEGMPLTLLEAMAAEVTVIASDVDGVSEIATNGNSAMLVPPGDVDGFVSAADSCFSNHDATRKMRTDARAHVVDHYDSRRLSKRLHDYYEADLRVLKGGNVS